MANPLTEGTITIPAFLPPGTNNYLNTVAGQMSEFGRVMRDEMLWKYPLMPEAVYIYMQMAAGREWKITGGPRVVARAVEYYNNAKTMLYDGTVDYGFEQFMRRRALDYVTVGRTAYRWRDGEPLEYIDPAIIYYDLNKKCWIDKYNQNQYLPSELVINMPIPLGASGGFMSPLYPVAPTAMLAWLIREHDRAAADGRKIRDIFLVATEELEQQFEDAVKLTLQLWSGNVDPTKSQVAVISLDPQALGVTNAAQLDMSKMVARVGLANIPENFNREQFQFQYVNELCDALGLALRYVWNSEKATNRALEEVQEARQSQRGPASMIRTEQRLHTNSGELKYFGTPPPRFNFLEEADIASQETNAKVLKLYAEAFDIFVKNLGGSLNLDSLIGWLQRDEILPADLDIITKTISQNPDVPDAPTKGKVQQNSDGQTMVQKAQEPDIEPDEISMNSRGQIIERRYKTFSFPDAIASTIHKAVEERVQVSFDNALKRAREINLENLKQVVSQPPVVTINPERYVTMKAYTEKADLTDEDHRVIKAFLDEVVV